MKLVQMSRKYCSWFYICGVFLDVCSVFICVFGYWKGWRIVG